MERHTWTQALQGGRINETYRWVDEWGIVEGMNQGWIVVSTTEIQKRYRFEKLRSSICEVGGKLKQ